MKPEECVCSARRWSDSRYPSHRRARNHTVSDLDLRWGWTVQRQNRIREQVPPPQLPSICLVSCFLGLIWRWLGQAELLQEYFWSLESIVSGPGTFADL